MYIFWQETDHICRRYIKKSNGPKFTDPSTLTFHQGEGSMDNHIITKFGTVVSYAYKRMCPNFCKKSITFAKVTQLSLEKFIYRKNICFVIHVKSLDNSVACLTNRKYKTYHYQIPYRCSKYLYNYVYTLWQGRDHISRS